MRAQSLLLDDPFLKGSSNDQTPTATFGLYGGGGGAKGLNEDFGMLRDPGINKNYAYGGVTSGGGILRSQNTGSEMGDSEMDSQMHNGGGGARQRRQWGAPPSVGSGAAGGGVGRADMSGIGILDDHYKSGSTNAGGLNL